MRNRCAVSTLIVIGVVYVTPAEAYLLDDAKEFPRGTTEAEVRSHFAYSNPTQISFPKSNMSGFAYWDLPGGPTFYFCRKILWSEWSTVTNVDLIKFRHLIEENTKLLGDSSLALNGQADLVGKEWTNIGASWKLPDGRIGNISLEQSSGDQISIKQRITDPDHCPE